VKVWPPAGQGDAPIQGLAWATLQTPDDVDIQGIAYVPDFDVELVGFGGESVWGMALPEGAWADRNMSPPDSAVWRTVAHGSSSAMVLATEHSELLYSTDGVSWVRKTGPNAALTSAGEVVWRETQEDYLFLGVDMATYAPVAKVSVDGTVWEDISEQVIAPENTVVNMMGWIDGAQVYLGVGLNLGTMEPAYVTSADGLSWAETGSAPPDPGKVTLAYSPSLGRYLIALRGGLFSSDDDLASLQPVAAPGYIFTKVVWCEGAQMFAASSLELGDWGSKLLLSRDGIDWTPVGLPQFGDSLHRGALPTDLVWVPASMKLVMSGTNSVTYHARMKG